MKMFFLAIRFGIVVVLLLLIIGRISRPKLTPIANIPTSYVI
jgi:hypothetical protein